MGDVRHRWGSPDKGDPFFFSKTPVVLKVVLVGALSCVSSWVLAYSGHTSQPNLPQPEVLAPGYGRLQYAPPAPGSYVLPALGNAADGEVTTSKGAPLRLYDLYGDKIILLSFIYTTCNDVNGCPLTTFVFQQINQRLKKEPSLAGKLRLISLSFDPGHDTPEVMQRYSAHFGGSGVEWRFLTTRSETGLKPILEAYNQSIQKDYDDKGQYLGTISHILRVFLIDRAKRIRNIYSVSFLHADTLINDIKTLLLEESNPSRVADTSTVTEPGVGTLSRAGDDKTGYESAEYQTRSLSIADRKGRPTDLVTLVKKPPLGLPPVPVPADNPVTAEKIALGRKLFFDRRLSLNDTFSCAMCHIPEQGFTSNELATAVGIEGRTVRRNAPTIYNVAYFKRLFHDGRENRLEQQVWSPMLARNEMGNPSIGTVIDKIMHMSDYEGLFERAFGGRGPTMETIGMALASYERTLISANAPFDRWYYGKQAQALSEAAKRGFRLFTARANCGVCHTIGPDYALFTDGKLHNTGIGYDASMGQAPPERKVQLAPGVFVNVASDVIARVSETLPTDLGLYEITQSPRDRWKYRTPSLRNVALTAPYMHNGSLSTLEEVVEFYNHGGFPNEVLHPLIRPLNLSKQDVNDLVAFLQSLTGDNVDELVSDAFAAPIGDLRQEDPNWVHEHRIDY